MHQNLPHFVNTKSPKFSLFYILCYFIFPPINQGHLQAKNIKQLKMKNWKSIFGFFGVQSVAISEAFLQTINLITHPKFLKSASLDSNQGAFLIGCHPNGVSDLWQILVPISKNLLPWQNAKKKYTSKQVISFSFFLFYIMIN